MKSQQEIIARLETVETHLNNASAGWGRICMENANQIDRESTIRAFTLMDTEILTLRWVLELDAGNT